MRLVPSVLVIALLLLPFPFAAGADDAPAGVHVPFPRAGATFQYETVVYDAHGVYATGTFAERVTVRGLEEARDAYGVARDVVVVEEERQGPFAARRTERAIATEGGLEVRGVIQEARREEGPILLGLAYRSFSWDIRYEEFQFVPPMLEALQGRTLQAGDRIHVGGIVVYDTNGLASFDREWHVVGPDPVPEHPDAVRVDVTSWRKDAGGSFGSPLKKSLWFADGVPYPVRTFEGGSSFWRSETLVSWSAGDGAALARDDAAPFVVHPRDAPSGLATRDGPSGDGVAAFPLPQATAAARLNPWLMLRPDANLLYAAWTGTNGIWTLTYGSATGHATFDIARADDAAAVAILRSTSGASWTRHVAPTMMDLDAAVAVATETAGIEPVHLRLSLDDTGAYTLDTTTHAGGEGDEGQWNAEWITKLHLGTGGLTRNWHSHKVERTTL